MSEVKNMPPIGSRWREDYAYGGGSEWDRVVEVVGHDGDRVLIRGVQVAKRPAGARITRAKADRFGKSRGYLPYTSSEVE